MKWKFEKEFREAHPEPIRETDKDFDLYNYTVWLEHQLEELVQPTDVDNFLKL